MVKSSDLQWKSTLSLESLSVTTYSVKPLKRNTKRDRTKYPHYTGVRIIEVEIV